MAYIKCYSHIQKKDVKYNLIGVKLKHKVKQEDYGTTNDGGRYSNTSPNLKRTHTAKSDFNYICNTSGMEAGGTLESNYDNSNTGRNPLITGRTFHVDELKTGYNIFELFETDNVKVEIEILKTNSTATFTEIDGTILDESPEVITDVVFRFINKSNNKEVGLFNMNCDSQRVTRFPSRPVKFSINSELFLIKDFNPMYIRSGSSETNRGGLYIEGSKSTDKGNFVGIVPSMLVSEWWQITDNSWARMSKHKIVDANDKDISHSKLRNLNIGADILYYRRMISEHPDEFIHFGSDQIDWAEGNLNSEGYKVKTPTNESTEIFRGNNYRVAPILMPCVSSYDFNPIQNVTGEGMFISLTQDIYEGSAPEPELEPEPLEPETVEKADNPETKYTPQPSDGNKEFEYPGMADIPKGPTTLNAFRNSYSNFIFKYFYHESEQAVPTTDPAIQFITDAANPSAFQLWGATFQLLSGHPTPDEIISRVYYLPFEYEEIRYTENKPGYPKIDWTVKAAPKYGPIGPLTMGAKEYTGSNKDTGEPITSNIHYYDLLNVRFRELDLGTTTITRVFNNFMDYSDVKYTLKLPYGAGDVALDPDFLFMNGISNGTVSLKGYLDFDTGELSIIILVNDHLYHETIVSVAIDRLANVEDKMAGPLAIGKAIAGAAATAGGIAKFAGGGGMPTPQTKGSVKTNNDLDLENGGKYFDEHGYARNLEIEELKKKYDKMGGI